MTTSEEGLGYAEAMAELEGILEQLEDDDIDVDVLSTLVERAAILINLCRGRIRAAQLSVQEIVADLDTFPEDADPADADPDDRDASPSTEATGE